MTNLEDLRFVPASYIRTSMRKIEVLIAALRKEDGIIGTAVADILEDGIFDDLDEAAEILEIGVSHA
jgi:hypothetical protein